MTIEEEAERVAAAAWQQGQKLPPAPTTGETQSALWWQMMSAAEVERVDERAWWKAQERKERRARLRLRLGIAARLLVIGLLWAAIARQYDLGQLSARAAGVMMVLVLMGVLAARRWEGR